ncbi:MAG: energy-coupling factor ABC transporter ATP-binding protein [Elusimicrobiota bacterium]|jgi:biotin transport system ATP-binding protein|nr:energy-coupling factor ABC transporter ATP-binding protein [Elusimicrobiota bacterium]
MEKKKIENQNNQERKYALSVRNIGKVFQSADIKHPQIKNGCFQALDNISFDILENDLCIIAGANGAGKTLLMSIIAGLEKASAGEIFLRGRAGLIFQDADAQILGETPSEDIAFGPKNLDLSENEIAKRIQSSLLYCGLSDKADFPARFLSGGEKKKLAIAGITAMGADIIIFDEPYSNLDYPSVCLINNLIAKLKKDGKTVIVLTHEIEKILALSNQMIILHKGLLVFNGDSREALSCDLERWAIKNPLYSYKKFEDLIWI